MKITLTVSQSDFIHVFGTHNHRKKEIEATLGVAIIARGDTVTLESRSKAGLKKAHQLLKGMFEAVKTGYPLSSVTQNVITEEVSHSSGEKSLLVTTGRRANIYARSKGQAEFYKAVQENDLVFAIGPAGTGKTYLAVAMALESLRTRQVERIILARPAVEAGESLGFLPGNLKEKVDPYLIPLYDSLYDILPAEVVEGYFENKTIEVSPLAYMRGRTLSNSFVILDEAQNATPAQLKMFLTRIGTGSKAIVAGDMTQIDLSPNRSGMIQIPEILKGIEGIAFAVLSSRDVMRHRLVREIIDAYALYEKNNGIKK